MDALWAYIRANSDDEPLRSDEDDPPFESLRKRQAKHPGSVERNESRSHSVFDNKVPPDVFSGKTLTAGAGLKGA
jgi:hypothetical protein